MNIRKVFQSVEAYGTCLTMVERVLPGGGLCRNRSVRFLLVVLISIVSIVPLSGCGTVLTRGNDEAFGAYPFEAPLADGFFIALIVPTAVIKKEPEALLYFPLFLISIPLDIAIDMYLLPADIIFWIDGKEKDWGIGLKGGFAI